MSDRVTRYFNSREVPCIRCGYNLRGLRMRVCPECGAEQRTQSERGVGWWWLTVGGVGATYLGLAGLGLAFLWLDVRVVLLAAAVLVAAQLQWLRWTALRASFLAMAAWLWRLTALGWWALAAAVWAGAWWANRAALGAWIL